MQITTFFFLCIFSAILTIIRILITGDVALGGLLWNLILAFIPYILARGYADFSGWKRTLSFILWIFFLPNSFYIVTDFVHLVTDSSMVYFDIIYILSMAFSGMITAFLSMDIVHKQYNIHYHKRLGWIFITGITISSMIGVYIGRFLRFNTWDIIQDPLNLLREIYLLLLSNGNLRDISDPYRLSESKLFEIGVLGLWQFVLLYSTFFMLIYIGTYHAKRK